MNDVMLVWISEAKKQRSQKKITKSGSLTMPHRDNDFITFQVFTCRLF